MLKSVNSSTGEITVPLRQGPKDSRSLAAEEANQSVGLYYGWCTEFRVWHSADSTFSGCHLDVIPWASCQICKIAGLRMRRECRECFPTNAV